MHREVGSRKTIETRSQFLVRGVCATLMAAVFGALFIVSNLDAHATPPPQTDGGSGVLVKAQSLLSQGMTEQAVRVLTTHLQNHPKDVSARLLLGEVFFKLGQTEPAEKQYRLVLKSSPENYLALARLGELYERAGHFDKAEPMLAQAVKHSSGEPQLRAEWATVLVRLHRFREASRALAGIPEPASVNDKIMLFRLKAAIAEGLGNSSVAASNMESALSLHPEDSGLAMATAVAQLHARNWQRAAGLATPIFLRTKDPAVGLVVLEAQLAMREDTRRTLESLHALKLSSNQHVALRQRIAELLISHGDFAPAVEELKQAVKAEPGNTDLIFNLALAQFKAGQGKEALATAESCKALRDSGELEDLLGDIQESLGDNLSAVRSYQAAVELAPHDEDFRISLTLELIKHRSFSAAKLVLKQAEGLFPKSWRIQLALGMVEYFVGTKENASRILLHAADLAPQPQLVLRYLGDVEMDEASIPDAAAVARICDFAKQHPEAGRQQFYCGALQRRTQYAARDKSHLDKIERYLTTAGKLMPNEAGPHCELGKLYIRLEEWKLAQRESELCAQLDPDSASAHYRLARVYRQTGQTERLHHEIELYKAASRRLADQNEERQKTLNTFIYTIRNKTTE
jgi:Flp pilus assembly protein TadD